MSSTRQGGFGSRVLGEFLNGSPCRARIEFQNAMKKFGRLVPRRFYNRDPRLVAPELLGKILVRREGRKIRAGRIVEVEAYLGENDPASHSARGETPRNAVMFGPAGFVYMYFIYGNHYCMNVSCLPKGIAGGILFRALEPLEGIEEMALARDILIAGPRDLKNLTSGPGRLAEALGITRQRDNGKDLTSAKSDLFIVEDPIACSSPKDYDRARRVLTTPRIGITKAADLPLRYVIAGNPFVSGRKLGSV
jgi:DNA-3-methyladenine glycosylase